MQAGEGGRGASAVEGVAGVEMGEVWEDGVGEGDAGTVAALSDLAAANAAATVVAAAAAAHSHYAAAAHLSWRAGHQCHQHELVLMHQAFWPESSSFASLGDPGRHPGEVDLREVLLSPPRASLHVSPARFSRVGKCSRLSSSVTA